MSNEIEISGLRELRGAFKQVDSGLPKELKSRFMAIATSVVSRVQSKVPRDSGEAAASLKPRATQRGAGIARPAGGTPWRGVRAAYYPWLDFGGKVGRGKAISRPFIKEGRYLYPTIAEARPDLAEAAQDAVADLAGKAGFEVR